jgi:hypothetical protein
MENGWKIHSEAELAADPWAGHIPTSQQGKGETHPPANCISPSSQALQLASTEPIIVCNTAIDLTPKSQPGIEIMQEGQAPGVNVATCGLNPATPVLV